MVLCRRTGRQRHLVPLVGVSSVCCAFSTLCCWYVAWTWVFSVAPRSLPLIGRMTSNCSRTSLHSASRGSHLWPGTGEYVQVLRVRQVSCKCLFCGRSSEASSSSPWHGSRVMPERYSVGTVQELLGCGACGMFGTGNWALRTVCKWSKSFMCGGAYGRRSSGFWCRVHLEFAYVAGCSLLVRHQGSHAWQSCADTLMVVGLVLASRSA